MVRSFTRRSLAVTSALALATLGTLGAGAAYAAPAGYGNIDHDQPASLTIHKFLHQTPDGAGDPSTDNSGTFTGPVKDVEFTVYPLLKGPAPGTEVTLESAADWEGLGTLTPGAGECEAPTGYLLGAGEVMPLTDADGDTTLSLEQGLYMVCETDAPANIVDRANPFILTLPLPYQNGWVYNVHAYPKNGSSTVEKTILPQEGLGIGSVVKFPVSVTIPKITDTWTAFAIRDVLDDRLTPVSPTAVSSVKVDGAPLDASFYSVTTVGQTVTMAFTGPGVAWLAAGNGVGKTIEVVFEGVVNSLGDGSIDNTASGWFNNPGFDPGVKPPVVSPPVTTNWGNVVVSKVAKDTDATLAGAVFEVYAAVAPYDASCDGAVATGSALSVGGNSTFTSSSTGVVTIPGLFVSDSENPVVNATQRCYVLKETVAPTGYVLPSNPYFPVAVTIGSTTGIDLEIENTQQTVPELPLTGAAGQVIMATAGVAILGLVVGLVLVNRHRAATRN